MPQSEVEDCSIWVLRDVQEFVQCTGADGIPSTCRAVVRGWVAVRDWQVVKVRSRGEV